MQLEEARAALCDLLIGRRFRIRAAELLEGALYLDSYMDIERYVIDELVNEAAHIEWIAGLAEQGLILWGGRLNRCGYQPRTEEDG